MLAFVALATFGVRASSLSLAAAGPSPYSGTPIRLPGTIPAELFDLGGEGIAFHDTTRGNAGGAFRSTDVDLEPSSEGGYDIGWTAAGEWLNYSVDVTSGGTYVARLRVASPSGATMHLGFNGPSNVWEQLRIPATGGWQAWTTVEVPVSVNAGLQLMTVLFDTGGMNLQKVTIAESGNPAPSPRAPPPPSGPFGSTPVVIPGLVEAENFDHGPDGVSYHDTTAGNTGGAYRSTGVDLEPASDGGFNIGWTAPGEWLNYTVNVPIAGAYVATIKAASPTGGAMHIGFNNASSVWKSVAIPATGGWQHWSTVQVPVTLGAGVQQLTVLFDTGGLNLDSIAVSNPAPGPASVTGTVLPVITWNIRINDSSEAHARLAMDLLVQTAPRPEIIVVEETYRQHFNTYLDELQRQTGRTWRGVFASHCAPGAWNGSTCTSAWSEGVSIFTVHEIVDTGSILMPYPDCWSSARTALRAAVRIESTTVQVFGTHLQSNSCGDMSGQRAKAMAQLKTWASTFTGPKIAAGDFNGDPWEVNTAAGMLPVFIDTWPSAGSGNHLTAYGPTPTRKIDYWFVDSSGRLTPQASEVVYSTGAESDHFPLRATLLLE